MCMQAPGEMVVDMLHTNFSRLLLTFVFMKQVMDAEHHGHVAIEGSEEFIGHFTQDCTGHPRKGVEQKGTMHAPT
jgi:hypothetical protein